ncbi:MAG TPA: hypothetical protein DEF45_08920 [Rhodopirellula sp.]|nr:hypothetical protein [Rhodopirellula sp.]
MIHSNVLLRQSPVSVGKSLALQTGQWFFGCCQCAVVRRAAEQGYHSGRASVKVPGWRVQPTTDLGMILTSG